MRQFISAVLLLAAAPLTAQADDYAAMPAAAMPPTDGGHDTMAAMAGMDPHAGHDSMADMHMGPPAAFGPYSATREASGSSWQPDTSTPEGLHFTPGDWAFMVHGDVDGVYTNQPGPRGGDKAFAEGHLMIAASHDIADVDRIQFRVALAPDPPMGPQGYPLLFASGETADGIHQLTDRQHPHDLFSEVSASISHRLRPVVSVFAYGAVAGEPAFGPPVFRHRQSVMDDAEAPISHRWLGSTHLSEGVVTLGVTGETGFGGVKVEALRFRGREPNQHRYDIEQPNLDSTAVRVAWNPVRTLSLQGSWADQVSPEQLTPDDDLERWSASAIYTLPLGAGRLWATTAAWGRRIVIAGGQREAPLDAYLLEGSVHFARVWSIFGRAERFDNNELLPSPGSQQGPAFTVAKVSLGAVRDFRITPHVLFGVGGVVSRSLTPGGLDAAYGGDQSSGTGFVGLKLG